jgi:hypothetical protein
VSALDEIIIGTLPSGRPSATVAYLRGVKSPALLFDVGMLRAQPWIAYFYASMIEPMGFNHGRFVPERVKNKSGAVAAWQMAERLVELILTGTLNDLPPIQFPEKNNVFDKVFRACDSTATCFVIAHELSHVCLGHFSLLREPNDVDSARTQFVRGSQQDEIDADELGFLFTLHAQLEFTREDYHSLGAVEQGLLDAQVVCYIEFFLWFFQALEQLVATLIHGSGVYFLDTDTHPSATTRRFLLTQNAVSMYENLLEPKPSKNIIDEAIAHVNGEINKHSIAWSYVIHYAKYQLKKALKEGKDCSPIWKDLRPCKGLEFLTPKSS